MGCTGCMEVQKDEGFGGSFRAGFEKWLLAAVVVHQYTILCWLLSGAVEFDRSARESVLTLWLRFLEIEFFEGVSVYCLNYESIHTFLVCIHRLLSSLFSR